MKYLYLLILLTIVTATNAFSQRFEGGLLGGLNASQVDGDTYSGYNKPGIVAGAYVINNFSERLFAGMEIKYAQKGSRKNPNYKTGDQDRSVIRLNYIDLPVYLGIHTGEKTAVLSGLSAGYLVHSSVDINFGSFQTEPSFKEFDIQGMLGFRFQLTNRLSVDLRGAYSVLPISNQTISELNYWATNQFNNLISTTVLYRLDF
ncbi:MAG: outer membrane beta-barrel protein [Methylococcaceae bacterium]